MKILIAEDDRISRRLLERKLMSWGYEVVCCANGVEAWQALHREDAPNLAILNWMMPGMKGVEVCREIRKQSRPGYTYIILLTGRDRKRDIVEGIEAGADDYITKPFSPRELVSRIRAVLRRTKSFKEDQVDQIIVDDRLTIDFSRREVWVEGKKVDLRPTEYRLLYHLVQNAGWVNTHEQLLSKVWGFEYQDEPHYVRLYVNYLRKKLEKDPSSPKYILTERGVGYRFVDYRRDQEKAE